MDPEILVHIKAASRVVDDKRYVAVAQGVIDFESAYTIRIMPCSTENLSNEQQVAVDSGLAQEFIRLPEKDVVAVQKFTSNLKKDGKMYDSYKISKTSLASRFSCVQKKVSNPPYRSPLRKPSIGSPCVGHTYVIPSATTSIRPVESDVHVLVPNTGKQTRKRNCSEAFLAQSEFTVISDSQQIHSLDPSSSSVPSWSRSSPSLIDVAGEQKGPYCKIGSVAMDPAHSSIGIDQQTTTSRPSTISYDAGDAVFRSDASRCAKTVSTRKEHEARSNNGSMDDRIAIDEDASTVTVSPQSQAFRSHHAGDYNFHQPMSKSLPIDLTTPQCSAADMQHEREGRFLKPAILPLQLNTVRSTNTSFGEHQSISSFAKVRALPLVISAPDPDVKQFGQPAYQQPIMKATAEALTLPRHFRPETMNRNIEGKERGYWKIPIKIVTNAQANRERLLAPDHMQGTASPGQKPLLKHRSLTESEFLEIWRDLNGFVLSGNTGWSVKIVRRAFSMAQTQNPEDSELDFHLQVFCYGEAVPYIYAMLLVCTRMYILCQPVEWISTVDDKPVVVMTGDERRKGFLGSWTCRTTDQQGKDFWGCSVKGR